MRGQRGRGGFAVGAGDDHHLGRSDRALARSRKKSSVSPMISTPASCACFTVQCGSGWVRGIPGASTSAAMPRPIGGGKIDESNALCGGLLARGLRVVPGEHPGAAGGKRVGRGDAAQTQPEHRERRGRGRWSRESSANLPQFQGGKAKERQHHGDDPEADHDRRFRPALLLVMVVQRRHAEDALARQPEATPPARSPRPPRARTGRRQWRAPAHAWWPRRWCRARRQARASQCRP